MNSRKGISLSDKVVNVPMIMQFEALECGAACLAMILAYYKKWIPIEQIRKDCGVTRNGSNARNIVLAGKNYNLEGKGYSLETEQLKNKKIFPCIIHWNFDHFVVLKGLKGGKVYINDPARGSLTIPLEEFEKSFTGVCLVFEPTAEFVPSGKQKSVLSYISQRLAGKNNMILISIVMGLVLALFGLLAPGFSRVYVDRILTGKSPDWIYSFLIILAVFNIFQVVLMGLRSIYTLRMNGKLTAISNTSYMWKILRLPMDFFSQRMAGDIQERKESSKDISDTIINLLIPIVVNSISMVFFFIIMLRYSVFLSAIVLVSVTVNIWVSRRISKKRINISRVAMRDNAKLIGTTVSGIEMIETIKANGSESGFFAKWAGYQASVNAQQVKFTRLNQTIGLIPEFILSLINIIVLITGAYLTIEGEFTVGMVIVFQGFLTSFMTPAISMINAGQSIQEMRTKMERIEDVMAYETDNVFKTESKEDISYERVRGNIELKNVTFGFSPLEEPLIKDISFTVKENSCVAIVGASGSGKSCLAKLISGLYKPTSGEILYDNKKTYEIDKDVFYSSISMVDQKIVLFEDTIENNIKMWDNTVSDEDMIRASEDAQIHSDILSRNGGYNARLTENGNNLSGGQRQRVEIARVLAQNPNVIIFDEATSALDAVVEHRLINSIKNRDITCIFIAHRLSTVRDCDNIILMDKGRISDCGTHKELMEKSEMYRNLISND